MMLGLLALLLLITICLSQTTLTNEVLVSASPQEFYFSERIFGTNTYYLVGGHPINNAVTYINKIDMKNKQIIKEVPINGFFEFRPTRINKIGESNQCFITGEKGAGIFDCDTGSLIKELDKDFEIQCSQWITHTSLVFFIRFNPVKLFLVDIYSFERFTSSSSNLQIQSSGNLLRRGTSFILFGGSIKYPNMVDYSNLKIYNKVLREKNAYPTAPNSPNPFFQSILSSRVLEIIEGFSKNEVLWSISLGYIYRGNDNDGISLDDYQIGQYYIGRFVIIGGSHFILYVEFIIFEPINTSPFVKPGSGTIGIYNANSNQNVYQLKTSQTNSYSLIFFRENLSLSYDRVLLNTTYFTATVNPILTKPQQPKKLVFQDFSKLTTEGGNCISSNCEACFIQPDYCIKCEERYRLQQGQCIEKCDKERYYDQSTNECLNSHCRNDQVMESGVCKTYCTNNKWLEDRSCLDRCSETRVKDLNFTCPINCGEGGILNKSTKTCEYIKSSVSSNNRFYKKVLRIGAISLSIIGFLSALISPSERESNFKLFQLFDFYLLFEKEYTNKIQTVLNIFGEIGISILKYRIFYDGIPRTDKINDKISEELDQNLFANSDFLFQGLISAYLFGLFCLLFKSFAFKNGKLNQKLLKNKKFLNEKSKISLFLNKVDFEWFLLFALHLIIDLTTSSTQNIFFSSYAPGKICSIIILFIYSTILLAILLFNIFQKKNQILVQELSKEAKTNRARFIPLLIYFSDYFKSIMIVIFRGNLTAQISFTILSHAPPIILWCTTKRVLIFEKAIENIFLLIREIFILISYICIFWSNTFTNNILFVAISMQIILVLLKFSLKCFFLAYRFKNWLFSKKQTLSKVFIYFYLEV